MGGDNFYTYINNRLGNKRLKITHEICLFINVLVTIPKQMTRIQSSTNCFHILLVEYVQKISNCKP